MRCKGNICLLDQTDLKILKALQDNARQTYTEIGRDLDLAHSSVYERIKKMERHRIIRKYTAIVDMEKIGPIVLALVTVFTDPKENKHVAEELAKSPKVLEVYTSLSEELLVLVKVASRSQEELHRYIASSLAPLPGVLRIRTSIISRIFKDQDAILAGPNKK